MLRNMTRRYTYQRMTAAQLSAALDELGLSMRQFARLYGSSEKRVEQWLRGEEEPPHTVAIVCALLTLPGAMALAKRVTDDRVAPSALPDDHEARRLIRENHAAMMKRRDESR